jgi:hypothetical protein
MESGKKLTWKYYKMEKSHDVLVRETRSSVEGIYVRGWLRIMISSGYF